MSGIQRYRRLSDGATSDFSVDPGDGWEVDNGPVGLPLPAPAAPLAAEPSARRFEYHVEKIGVLGREQRMVEAIADYAAQGFRLAHVLNSDRMYLIFERPVSPPPPLR